MVTAVQQRIAASWIGRRQQLVADAALLTIFLNPPGMGLGRRKAEIQRSDRAREGTIQTIVQQTNTDLRSDGADHRKSQMDQFSRQDQHRCGALNCQGLLVSVALWKAWPLCGVNALAVVHPMRAIEKGRTLFLQTEGQKPDRTWASGGSHGR